MGGINFLPIFGYAGLVRKSADLMISFDWRSNNMTKVASPRPMRKQG